MTDAPDNLVLQLLRKLDGKVDRLADDMSDLKMGMTHVEENLAGVHRRLDRTDQRIDRIERRLELSDHPYGGVRE
jgi:predicted nuclease with TOPRIM domain